MRDRNYIDSLVAQAKREGASDIHLIAGLPPKYRLDGQIEDMHDEVLTEKDLLECAEVLSEGRFEEFMKKGELDAADTFADNRCRIHLFKQQGIPSVALRLLREQIPELETLSLPAQVQNLTTLHNGIVLVTGETGSGKSTTLAALIDRINHTRKCHIVTLEDPVEYLYKPALSIINQREVGKDTESFSEGLRAALREDPDVILIGEMRDRPTIETAITAAETGHLVFGTLHTGSAVDSIDRMVQVFPAEEQQQIRLQLSMVLQAVITQQLIPKQGGGRALACEVMIANFAIRNNIRSGNTPNLYNAIMAGAAFGNQTMDQALQKLQTRGIISPEQAKFYSRRGNEEANKLR